VAQPIPRERVGHLVRLVRAVVWVTESQEVGWKHGSSCDSVTPAFFRKRVLKWRRLLRKNDGATREVGEVVSPEVPVVASQRWGPSSSSSPS